MKLYLRQVIHPQAHDNYRVILELDGSEVEIGSIGIQHGAAWRWEALL
jgi:NADH:ubiquinone oxidoreductase subunit D